MLVGSMVAVGSSVGVIEITPVEVETGGMVSDGRGFSVIPCNSDDASIPGVLLGRSNPGPSGAVHCCFAFGKRIKPPPITVKSNPPKIANIQILFEDFVELSISRKIISFEFQECCGILRLEFQDYITGYVRLSILDSNALAGFFLRYNFLRFWINVRKK